MGPTHQRRFMAESAEAPGDARSKNTADEASQTLIRTETPRDALRRPETSLVLRWTDRRAGVGQEGFNGRVGGGVARGGGVERGEAAGGVGGEGEEGGQQAAELRHQEVHGLGWGRGGRGAGGGATGTGTRPCGTLRRHTLRPFDRRLWAVLG